MRKVKRWVWDGLYTANIRIAEGTIENNHLREDCVDGNMCLTYYHPISMTWKTELEALRTATKEIYNHVQNLQEQIEEANERRSLVEKRINTLVRE